ncbi:MAG TPA: methionine synthase [Trebonia sp.]
MTEPAFPWAPGTATGIGSMPGDNPLEAARVIADELPGLPHLPELPGRGPGADLTGRTAALLVEMPVELAGPRGWRIAERPGLDARRAKNMLSSDLDALEEVLDGYQGPVKIQLAGPWTLAATIEQPRSLNPALADPGLVADLTSSLAEGVANHVAEVAKRVPGATLIVQFDEPSLPAVMSAQVPTPSGLGRVRVPDDEIVRARLREVLDATRGYTVVHCCAPGYPFGIITEAGANALSFDLAQIKPPNWDELAEIAEAGTGLFVGAVSPLGPQAVAEGNSRRNSAERSRPTPTDTAKAIADLWRKMSQPPAGCAGQVVVTPACGLAGASPDRARAVLRWCREAGGILPEMMGEQA